MDDRRVGTTVAGKYALKRLVGTGSMGEVYEGTHLAIGKRIAVKLMNAMYADAPEVVARFRREARAASAIESDYIVQVFDAGADPQHGLFIVTEFLVGEDLETRLAREGRLDPGVAVTMGYQLARGLAKAHAAGVVHRDIKPANIFLTLRDDDTLLSKLLDFGISKITIDDAPASRRDVSLTGAGLTLGTPQYMSPEQVQALADIDGRTDVWSLAAVLYEALSGVAAIPDSASTYEVLMSIVNSSARPIRQVAPWVPEALSHVVMAGLERDRTRRIPDAATFAQRLKQAAPDSLLQSAARLSLPDAAALAAQAPELEEGIPVSIAIETTWEDDAPSQPEPPQEPITARDPTLRPPVTETLKPPPAEADEPPPPSAAPLSTGDRVEIFQRLTADALPVTMGKKATPRSQGK